MRCPGKWITPAERDQIRHLVLAGWHDTEIADEMICSRMTVYRFRHIMGLPANRACDRTDTNARRAAAIKAAYEADGLKPGDPTRIAYAIRSLRIGWPGLRWGHARVLAALESLEGGPASWEEIADAASRDGTGRPMTKHLIVNAASTLRRVGLMVTRRTKNPGGGGGGTPVEYRLSPTAVANAEERDAARRREKMERRTAS